MAKISVDRGFRQLDHGQTDWLTHRQWYLLSCYCKAGVGWWPPFILLSNKAWTSSLTIFVSWDWPFNWETGKFRIQFNGLNRNRGRGPEVQQVPLTMKWESRVDIEFLPPFGVEQENGKKNWKGGVQNRYDLFASLDSFTLKE